MTLRLSRRGFLGALGAAAIPLFDAEHTHAGGARFPTRLVVLFTPNGTLAEHWRPTGSETDFQLGAILAPLAPFRRQLLVLGGIHMLSARHGVGAPHSKGIGQLLTGTELLRGTFVGGGGQNTGYAGGISVDQFVAAGAGHDRRFRSLELAVQLRGSDVRARLAYRGPNQPLPPMEDPRDAFARVFGDLTRGIDGARARARRRSVLDHVRGDLAGLARRVGDGDRRKLEAHLAAVRELERRLDTDRAGGARCRAPDAPPVLDPAATESYPAVGRAHMDLIAMALACDLTRVVTLQWSRASSQMTFPWLGIPDAHHDLSHAGDGDRVAQDKLLRINRWYAEQVAYLLDRLRAIPEGDGTLLDHSVVVWASELGRGNTHSLDDIPFVLAGSAGGYFRTGRWVRYAGRSHNDLLVSLCHALGVPTARFGNPAYCTGPLEELR